MYIVLNGNVEELMSIDDQEHKVFKGDMILNRPGGRHGLLNNGFVEMELLVI